MSIELVDESERAWLDTTFGIGSWGYRIRLYKATFDPAVDSVLADFLAAEADFTGYPGGGIGTASSGPAGSEDGEEESGKSYKNMNCATFVKSVITEGDVTNSIGGWWLDNTSGGSSGSVLCFEEFSSARPMVEVGDTIVVCPRICCVSGCT